MGRVGLVEVSTVWGLGYGDEQEIFMRLSCQDNDVSLDRVPRVIKHL